MVLGGTALISVPVADLPNGLELQFAVPCHICGHPDVGPAGTLTTYVFLPASFAFDKPYFLPNPSPGGTVTVPPDLVGTPTDAFFVLSLVEVSDDTTAPTCQADISQPGLIKFTVQDVDSGLDSITASRALNAVVEVPSFTSGTTAPVVVTATIRDPTRTTSVLLKVADEAGNSVFCKRTVLRRVITRERRWGN